MFFRRVLAWLLSALMSFSSAPVQDGNLDFDFDFGTEGIKSSLFEDKEITLLKVILEANTVLLRYFGKSDVSESEIADSFSSMGDDTINAAKRDIRDFISLFDGLSELNKTSFISTNSARALSAFAKLLGIDTGLNAYSVSAPQSKTSLLDGKVEITDSAGSLSASGNYASITVKAGLVQAKSTTIDIYNNTGAISTLSFDYAASNYKSFSLGNATGSYSVLLNPGAGITIGLEAGAPYKEAKLELKNVSLVAAQESSDVTFEFDSAYGGVTVNGSAVSNNSVKNITLKDGATLVATAKNNGQFLGWINTSNSVILSTETTYKLTPVADMTVRAVFTGASGIAYFKAGSGNYLFDNLNNAISYASKSGNSTVVLMNNGTLSAGNYTVPSGVTLLIPFDAANTIYTSEPESVSDVWTKPTAYRTLTMANGANLTVNGNLCVPAKHYSTHGSKLSGNSPSGPCGFIKMNDNSNITVNSGGNLYAYGFITGTGKVVAKNGANIYEYFQIMDFRGGSQTSDMENGVFPLSQYYIQNIEVPLVLETGSVENCYATMFISNMSLSASVTFIAKSGGMFNLTSGTLTKRYDGSTDRLIFELDGTMSISPIEMEFGSGLLSTKINSKNYELPINNNITVKANSGSVTLSQDVAMLPGSEFIIAEGAKCVVASGCNVYVYDADQWGGFCGPANKEFFPVQYAPGKKYNRTSADLKDASIKVYGTLDASSGYIYTTSGGADISGAAPGKVLLKKGSQTKTYQLVQKVGYTEIPITPAKLKNADGTYFTPSASSSTNYCVNGMWREHSGHSYTETLTTAPTCETAGLKTFTCFCGSKYTESVPATGHTEGAVPDCTTNQVCTVCGKELAPSLGHNYSSVITAPTCTENGYTTHTCSRCGDIYTDSIVDAKGHKESAEATCTTNQICTVCGVELKPATGHNYKDVVTEATCTENGYTTHTCLNCGDEYVDSEVSATGHTAGADATCTEPQSCTVCGEILKSENGHTAGNEADCTNPQRCTVCDEILVEALGHDMIHDDAQDSTCTEEGYSSGSVCSRCGHTEGKTVIPAKGHKAGDEATCLTNQICTVCGVELKPATGHNYQEVITLPTCTEEGYTTHTCLNCGDSYVDSKTKAKGHSEGDAATCTSAQVCTDCGVELAPVLGHLPGAEATCTEPQICLDCGEVLELSKGHTPGEAATCTSAHICTVCGEELASATGHNYVSTVTAPTCTEKGFTTHTCSGCGDTYTDSEVDATGHDMIPSTCYSPAFCVSCTYTEGKALGHKIVEDVEIPATCTQSGFSGGEHCEICHAVIVEPQFVEALGHDIIKHEAKNPTYTEVGWNAYEECSRCDYTTYEEIPMLEEATVTDYESFIENLAVLEELAMAYAMEVPGKDPLELVIKYIRTGVDKYNEGSWGIMAGYADADFEAFVSNVEDEINASASADEMITVSGLKNIETFTLPNGDLVDFGHMFGSMDITYYNKGSLNHADVSGWAGDLVDLLEFSDYGGVSGTLNEMIAEISTNYLLQEDPEEIGGFDQQDMYGDLDSYYIMKALETVEYEQGILTEILSEYFTEELTMEDRADFFLQNRLGGVSTRANVRDAVYNAYTGNKMITTLEATKEFKTEDVAAMRKACCYAFADYICKLAGDYVEVTENPYFTVFETETSTLAPGIVQNIKKATSADNKQMVYYTATADLTRNDVDVFANYRNNDPTEWGMQTVLGQANAAQEKYGNPESDKYIENYNVIASINGDGYNMGTGEPGGLLIMDGREYHAIDGGGFFGITKDGKAIIGSQSDYNKIYKDQLRDAIGGFGTTLIRDGEVVITATSNYYTDRASRTAVGITKTGKVVFMVLDGRQEPISCGGSMIEIAHIMYEAGCIHAINLDGGGSTTYVAKLEGADKLSVVSKPSDGTARSVSTSLIMVSTAPSSTAFDHAIIESETDYLTKDSSLQLTAHGVSATGNSADIPEGTHWAVSDESWGSVTQDGVFTALRNGSVDVYLMLGDEIIGSKKLNVVVPDRIYFTKTNINATYGEMAELPLVALYQNKPVTIKESDVVFTLGNDAAGVMDGFGFIGTDGTGIKTVNITASLAADSQKNAVITVSLYNKGEISFDFDNATGGDRLLAWSRKVSNSTTEDNAVYEIVDESKPMVTDYTFAIDMTYLPIPEQLADLTSMLPGAEIEGASAWTFLMQLAERVSVLTEVKASVTFDKNLDVDYSEVTLVNDYFELNAVEFDEETNTLTLVLNWIDQTQPIDPAMANPLCILRGIKAVPKADAQWHKDMLNPVNAGEISYKVYMRANALYTFALKPENQQEYGVQPFINMFEGKEEKGGWFGSVYGNFNDTYTLSKAVKDGWVNEDGGFAYYIDGVKCTGINLVDGYYYDFGENGINAGQTKYTGLFYDETAGVYRYSKIGELASGWHQIGEDWYYFHSDTMAAKAGTYNVGTVPYEFEETGKITSGVWVKCVFGYRYYYGPSYYRKGWAEIDGNTYYFYNSYRYEGYRCVQESNSKDYTWYNFGDDGIRRDEVIPDGFYTEKDGSVYYVKDGIALKGLNKIDGDYYYFDYRARAVTGKQYCETTFCDLPVGTYEFGPDYKALNGLVEKSDGTICYYVYGKPKAIGLVEIDGDLYFAQGSNGEIAVNVDKYVWEGNGILPEATYAFGPDGKMLDGVVERNGVLCYYEKGKPKSKGLVEVDGALYFAYGENGEVAVNGQRYVWEGNGILPEATYEFGPDGKMLDGVVEKGGALFYYVKGKPKMAGLIDVDGAIYYAYGSNGEICVSEARYVSSTNGILPAGTYEFGPDGILLDGLVTKNGTLYYYVGGKPKMAGLIEIDGAYYFAYGENGEVCVDESRYVWEGNGILPEATYEFGPDGKMLNGIVNKDGVLYYYLNGRPNMAGLIKIDGAYYFANGKNGELCVNETRYVWNTNGLVPEGTYEFGADGKLLDGIVNKNGTLYYYVLGRPKMVGLIYIDGAYYFANGSNGEICVNETRYVWEGNGLLPEDEYEFGPDGKMVDGFFEKDGVKYYYVNGRPAPVGLNYVDGYYYFVKYDGSLICNQTYYAWETNGLSIEMNYVFDENGRIVG